MAESARILIEVVAGLIPGEVMVEHTQKWAVSSSEWDNAKGFQIALDRMALAQAYAANLQLMSMSGREVNWVRIDWIWL